MNLNLSNIITALPFNVELSKFVEYYIYISVDASLDKPFSQKTFPNNNKCLALYKGCRTLYDKTSNLCTIKPYNNYYSSFFHNHSKPFVVKSHSSYEQVCIIFREDGLQFFSDIPIPEINNEAIFEQLFGLNIDLVEHLFETRNIKEKTLILDNFLLKKIKINNTKRIYNEFLNIMLNNPDQSISFYASNLFMDESTLYRKIFRITGKSPKQIQQEIRFRSILKQFSNNSFDSIVKHISNSYYDQAHFIKEFNRFAGMSPVKAKQLIVTTGPFIFMNE